VSAPAAVQVIIYTTARVTILVQQLPIFQARFVQPVPITVILAVAELYVQPVALGIIYTLVNVIQPVH